MGRFLLSQLLHRRSRTATLAAGILVAAVSFVLLTSAVSTSALEVRGTVTQNWKTAYDILVRPPNSFTPLEREQGLVRDNYLSGIYGGITLDQWRQILRIPGVEVAAPIANIGYVFPSGGTEVPMKDLLNKDPVQLYRVRNESIADAGTSRYSGSTSYVYVTRRHRLDLASYGGGAVGQAEELPDGTKVLLKPCGNYSPAADRPFDRATWIDCYSSRSRDLTQFLLSDLQAAASEVVSFPILITAIDPVQEARLIGLDGTIVSGRYLREGEQPRIDPTHPHRLVPMIASSRAYVDENVVTDIERLTIPDGADVPNMLSERGTALSFLSGLRGREIAKEVIQAQDIYDQVLAGTNLDFGRAKLISDYYWTASPVAYREAPTGRLVPIEVMNPPSTWSIADGSASYQQVPMANADAQFRRLYPRFGSGTAEPDKAAHRYILNTPVMKVVGRYDPERLPGFSPLTEVPLETYYPPEVLAGDDATSRALGGKALLPSQNIGGYIAQPPLFLTTLQAMQPFLNPKFYAGATGANAPISVIRVRVSGVTGPDAVSRERVRRVAQAIRERTGLAVDITAGSSPHPLLVELPAGRFGRPALTVTEGWTKKGVAFAIVSALDRKSLALFVLVLVVSGLFLANGSFASVRSRRTEIGTLLCLGWGRGRIFRAILGELAVVGLSAGLVGTGLAFLLVKALSLDMSPLRTLLVAPVAVALAAAAGLIPAWRAARSVPLDAVRPAVAEPRRGGPSGAWSGWPRPTSFAFPGGPCGGRGPCWWGWPPWPSSSR